MCAMWSAHHTTSQSYVKEICEFGYGICKKNCPEGAIKLVKAVAVIDQEKCTQCGTCIEKCPRNAIVTL